MSFNDRGGGRFFFANLSPMFRWRFENITPFRVCNGATPVGKICMMDGANSKTSQEKSSSPRREGTYAAKKTKTGVGCNNSPTLPQSVNYCAVQQNSSHLLSARRRNAILTAKSVSFPPPPPPPADGDASPENTAHDSPEGSLPRRLPHSPPPPLPIPLFRRFAASASANITLSASFFASAFDASISAPCPLPHHGVLQYIPSRQDSLSSSRGSSPSLRCCCCCCFCCRVVVLTSWLLCCCWCCWQ